MSARPIISNWTPPATPRRRARDLGGNHARRADTRGTYLATWRKVTGQWVIENELFVTLS